MKINWGVGIVLAFVGFIVFILYFVIRMSMDDSANHDLVTKEYYKQELNYQQELDAAESAQKMNAILEVVNEKNGLTIFFPEHFDEKNIEGTIFLYRPSNRKLDTQISIALKEKSIYIPSDQIVAGRWDITVKWTYKGTQFLHKEKITL